MKITRKYEKPTLHIQHQESNLMAAISQDTQGQINTIDNVEVELDAREVNSNIWE